MGSLATVRKIAWRYLDPESRALAKEFGARLWPSNLEWLASVYGTDKGRHHPRRAGHAYMGYYQAHLARFNRRRPICLLEIGIASGASLLLWQRYFPKATVAGIDINPSPVAGHRIHAFVGAQQDEEFLARVIEEIGPPNVVIDDGSHIGTHINKSFEFLWPRLQPGGVYVIEDTQTADEPDYGGGPPGTPNTSTTLAQSLVGEVRESVAELHVYPEITFIVKRA